MKPTGTIFLETLGCKLNQAESESLAMQFLKAGYGVTNDIDHADIYLLNTCTVTHIADRKSRHLLRMARRKNPGALIIATGCYVQRARGKIAGMDEVDLAVDNSDKEHLIDIITALHANRAIRNNNKSSDSHNTSFSRTRSQIKIQEGCSNFCAFCIVPYVRGQERSFPPEQVITEIKTRVAQGYKEVTLTGTRIGSYGQDRTTPESHITLEQLIVRILNETRIERLRLSSLQLQNLTSGLFNLLKKERLCRHIHISLQSGCDRTLQRMRRRYSTTDYQQAISSARQAIHGLAVTTDVIVGFPGETDAEFDESYQFCRDMNFARIHVFPYSLREGTAAAKMPDQVPEMIKRERTLKMLTLAQESAHIFRTQFTGKTITALWEKNTGNDLWSGLTDNYIRVFTTSKEILTNRPLPVKLSTETANGMLGTLVN